jgi:hypothetical protein
MRLIWADTRISTGRLEHSSLSGYDTPQVGTSAWYDNVNTTDASHVRAQPRILRKAAVNS